MVLGDSRHYTHECEVVLNPTEGRGQQYAVREAGHHATSTHSVRGGAGDFGMDPHTLSSDTVDGLETYTQRLAPSYLFQTVVPTIRQTTLWVLASRVLHVANQRRTLSVLDCTDCMRRARWKIYQDRSYVQLLRN
jgi:hypothetical protein